MNEEDQRLVLSLATRIAFSKIPESELVEQSLSPSTIRVVVKREDLQEAINLARTLRKK